MTRFKSKKKLSGLPNHRAIFPAILLIFAVGFGGCAAKLRTKVSGNLNQVSRNMTVAILPVGTTEPGQKDAARLLRQDIYASLKQSRFHILERYIVDELLKQNSLTRPEDIDKADPIRLGEILGTDAVLISTMTKVKRSYFVLHSSIELGVSATLIDTRTGEILWMADQTETDFDGIGKIPTGIISAVLAPINLVTNKINLRRMTQKMTTKLTALVKKPNLAAKEEQFDSLVVASAATKKISGVATQPILAPRETQAEAYRSSAVYHISTSVPNPRKDTVPALVPILVVKTFQPISRPARSQTVAVHPASFSSITTNDQQTRKTQMTVLSPAPLSQIIAPVPQSKTMASMTHKITPLAVVDTAASRRNTIKTAALKLTPTAKKKNASAIQPVNVAQSVFYTIQVGAYEIKSFAKDMISKLSRKGYHAFLTPFKKDHSLVYKVHVEKFTDKQKAYLYAHDFYAQEKLEHFVTTLRTG